jgi:hypothetical protein
MRASALVAFCMLWSGTTSAQVPGEGSTDLLRYYGERAALIQMVGELPDAIPRLITQGSGFLIDDRLVLTADHILPETGDDYKRTYVNVRLGSREVDPIRGTVVARDPVNDIALVSLDVPAAPKRYCPVSVLQPPAQLAGGSVLLIMSFPLDQGLESNLGILSSLKANGRFITRLPLYPGDSGAPIFSSKGFLVAIVTGAFTEHKMPDGTVTFVESLGQLVSVGLLATSPVGTYLSKHATSGCWRQATKLPAAQEYAWTADETMTAVVAPVNVSNNATAAPNGGQTLSTVIKLTDNTSAAIDVAASAALGGFLSIPMIAAEEPPPLPDTMRIAHDVEVAKEPTGSDATEDFTRVVKAEEGYRIEECATRIVGQSHAADIACDVAADRKSATLRFRLSAGPGQAPPRGWLQARLSLGQRRADLASADLSIKQTIRKPVSVMLKRHDFGVTTKTYRFPYTAEPGQRISECAFEGVSQNKVDKLACEISPDGSAALLTFRLRSGPFIDQWRGWLDGQVRIVESKSN